MAFYEELAMRIVVTGRQAWSNSQAESLIERRIRFALTRFAPAIGDVTVILRDESGPRGAPARKCQVVVGLRPRGSVVVNCTGSTFEAAVSNAAERASRNVARSLERKRHAKRYQRRRVAEEPTIDIPAA